MHQPLTAPGAGYGDLQVELITGDERGWRIAAAESEPVELSAS